MLKNFPLLSIIFLGVLNLRAQDGTIEWIKSAGGTGRDYAYAVRTDLHQNTITVGTFSDTCDMHPSAGTSLLFSNGNDDVFIIKSAPDGSLIWAKSFGSSLDDECLAITLDKDGNIYMTGYFKSSMDFDPGPGIFNLSPFGWTDIFVCKLDNDGHFIWAKNIGGAGEGVPKSIYLDELENVLIAGWFDGTQDYDPGSGVHNLYGMGYQDIFVFKLSNSGSFLWAKSFGSSGQGEFGQKVVSDSQNNIYIAGTYNGQVDFDPGPGTYISTSLGALDAFILKLNESGDFIWMKNIGGAGSDGIHSMTVDSENLILIGCFTNSVDFDPGSDTLILQAPPNSMDMFLLKMGSYGNLRWARSFGGKGFPYNIVSDKSGNIYASGSFYDSLDLNLGPGVFNIFSDNGACNSFIAKWDQTGEFLWGHSYVGANDCRGFDITLNSDGVYMAGLFTDYAFADGDSSSFPVISEGSQDWFLMKVRNTLQENKDETTVLPSLANIFTPNGDGLNDEFKLPSLETGKTFKIFNRWGVEIISTTSEIIKNSGWDGRTTAGEECSAGVYYYLVKNAEKEPEKGFIQLIR